jgi:hypothetical protein
VGRWSLPPPPITRGQQRPWRSIFSSGGSAHRRSWSSRFGRALVGCGGTWRAAASASVSVVGRGRGAWRQQLFGIGVGHYSGVDGLLCRGLRVTLVGCEAACQLGPPRRRVQWHAPKVAMASGGAMCREAG